MIELRYEKLRANIKKFLSLISLKACFDNEEKELNILEIGAGDLKICKTIFGDKVETMDISGKHDYIEDICSEEFFISSINSKHREGYYYKWDAIFLIEVLEHLKDPFEAARNVFNLLKKDGIVIISVPFAFREHCPNDYWRFTETGLRKLFGRFKVLDSYYAYFNKEDEKDNLPLNIFMILKKGV